MFRILYSLFVLVWMVSTGCGDTENTDMNGTRNTREGGCESIGRAFCDRSLTCNLTFTDRELCTERFVVTCCEDNNNCGQELSPDETTQYNQCSTAVQNAQCEGFPNPIPAVCDGLESGI